MNLYLIRHADAAPARSSDVTEDAARPLSPAGKRQTAALAAWLQALGVQLDKVATSPLTRAVETADELVRHLQQPALPVVRAEPLAPGGESKKLAKLLRGLDAAHVALIGHEPDLSRHTAWLIGSKKSRLEFAKAGAACVHCDEPPRKGAGVLLWLMTPETLAAGAAPR